LKNIESIGAMNVGAEKNECWLREKGAASPSRPTAPACAGGIQVLRRAAFKSNPKIPTNHGPNKLSLVSMRQARQSRCPVTSDISTTIVQHSIALKPEHFFTLNLCEVQIRNRQATMVAEDQPMCQLLFGRRKFNFVLE
jgi:hypothetical protein